MNRSLCAVVLSSCVAFGAGTARAELVLSPDRVIDAPATAAASLDQQTPSVAFGAGVYLAVWRDGDASVGQEWVLRAVRIKQDGTFLDDPPLVVRDSGEDLVRPAVAFDGTNFLVVWERAGTNAYSADIFGAYVAPSTGKVGSAFPIVESLGAQTQPAIAGGDGYALVTYNEFSTVASQGAQSVWGLLLGQNQVIRPNFQISAVNELGLSSAVAWSSAAQTFLVAWRDSDVGGNILASQVSTTGAQSARYTITQSSNTSDDVAVGVLGSTFVIGWADEQTYPTSIYARAVPSSGAPTSGAFVLASPPAIADAGNKRPQILGLDGQFFGLWESVRANNAPSGYGDLYGGRFLANGTRTDGNDGVQVVLEDPVTAPALPGIQNSYRSAVATDGTKGMGVYWRVGSAASKDDVLFVPIDPSVATLVAQRPGILAREPNLERSWSVASNGQQFLLVWEDSRDGGSTGSGLDVYGLRIALDGSPIDAAPFVISTDDAQPDLPAAGDQFQPVVSGIAGGGDFLVVWTDNRGFANGNGLDLYGARVGLFGPPLQIPQHIAAEPGAQLQATIASNHSGWLVAWEDWGPSYVLPPHASAVFSTFVPSAASAAPFAPHQLSLASPLDQTACAPTAAWNGSHFLVAFERPCAEDFAQPQADLVGRWHDPDGSPLGFDVALAVQDFSETSPSLTALDGRIYAAWREQGAQNTIQAASVADLATHTDGASVAVYAATGIRQAPSISAAGGVVMVSWIESLPPQVSALRLRANAALTALDAAPIVLYSGATYTGPGKLPASLDRDGIGVSQTARLTPKPSLASAASGETLVTYNALESLEGRSIPRAHFRKFGLAGNGSACNDPGACADGICTRGACCDVACDGVCQRCGQSGCVETPDTDTRCPTDSSTDCASLSTSCRTYASGPPATGRCAAFGECASVASSGSCTSFTDATDGTSCSAPGCTGAASCSAGACACATEKNSLSPAHNLGCDYAPGESVDIHSTSCLFMLLMLAAYVRRRWLQAS